MNSTMTWRAIVAFCAVCTVGLWGCGGSGGGTEYHRVIPAGYTEVSFTADGVGIPGVQIGLGVLLDYTDTGTGTATGAAGPTSITDTADVDCVFTADTATTGSENYEIVTAESPSSSTCLNDNECILCTVPAPTDGACSITCAGVVPSSAEAAAETFEVYVTFTSVFATDMPEPYGTIRFDASTADTDFDLTTSLPSGAVLTGCDGAPDMTAAVITQATWFAAGDSQAAYRHGYTLSDVAELGCTVTHKFGATAALTGLATGGTTATNNLGTVVMNSKICDDKETPEVAHTASVCGEGAP